MTTTRSRRNPLFSAPNAEAVLAALQETNAVRIAALQADLADALAGSDDGARRYLRSYRALTGALLDEAQRSLPHAVLSTSNGDLAIAYANGRPARALSGVLDNASVEAPFTAWANRYELGEAVALFVTDRVRSLIGAPALTPPREPLRPPVDDVTAQRFQRSVRRQLDNDDDNALERLMRTFQLSKSELGRLFGVSRQAVDGWLQYGVPADRQEKVATLSALADLLERKLKTGRIPGIARRPADAYGNQTMLELIAADRHRELLALVRDSFAWSEAA